MISNKKPLQNQINDLRKQLNALEFDIQEARAAAHEALSIAKCPSNNASNAEYLAQDAQDKLEVMQSDIDDFVERFSTIEGQVDE